MTRRLCSIITLLVSFLLSTGKIRTHVTMPSFFSDGMVLQQQNLVAIWGSGDRKQQRIAVKPSWSNKGYTTVSDDLGRWKMKLETPVYDSPYNIGVSGGETVRLGNILIDETWLCSGQSNMGMRMGGRYDEPVIGSLGAIVTSRGSQMRMFTVDGKTDSIPLVDCEERWQEVSSKTVPDFTATRYFFVCKLNSVLGMPVRIIHAGCGSSRVEAWMSKESIEPYKDLQEVRSGSILYNGMLSPVIGCGIRGCLWYQGGTNIDAPDLYTQLFPALMNDWRRQWEIGEFPFYYTQITPFDYNKGEEKGGNSVFLRETQMKCLKCILSSGMIILTDVGDAHTIHPMEEETVGNRFVYLALGHTYGKKGFPVAGPLYRSMRVEGDKIILSFDEIGRGLTTFHRPFTGFEIAGEDRMFHPADAHLGKDTQAVVVSNPEVKHPVVVRYASEDYMGGCLFNMSGLPVPSFRTDDW